MLWKKLHRVDTTVSSTQAYFGTLLQSYPTIFDCLGKDTQIVYDLHSESAIFKISENQESCLDITGIKHVSGLLLEPEVSGEWDIADDSIVERVAKCIWGTERTKSLRYLDTRFLLTAWSMCEKLFSIAGHALSGHLEEHLAFIFRGATVLYINRELLNIDDVKSVAKK